MLTQDYGYDGFSRLNSVTDSGLPTFDAPAATQKFFYDRRGNQAVKTGSYVSPGFPADAAHSLRLATQAEADVKFPKNRFAH